MLNWWGKRISDSLGVFETPPPLPVCITQDPLGRKKEKGRNGYKFTNKILMQAQHNIMMHIAAC